MRKVEENNLIESSYVVYKGNDLISAKSDAMTALESKLLLTALSKCDSSPESIDTIRFDVIEYCKLANIKSEGTYDKIARACQNLVRKGVFLKLTGTKEKNYSWVSDSESEYGEVAITINPTIKPLISFRKNVPYTKFLLSNILRMNSKHSIRLYEILKQYEQKKIRTIALQELKDIMGLSKQYKTYKPFRIKVLEVACTEINKVSDIKVSFTPIKTGRRVTEIKFTITSKLEISEYAGIDKARLINKLLSNVSIKHGYLLNKSILTSYHRIVLIDLIKSIEHGFTCEVKSEGFFYNLLKLIKEKYSLEDQEDY